jgi:hypothetical protein
MNTYRYNCHVDGEVYETLSVSDPAPTVCKIDGSPIIPGTLTLFEGPEELSDVKIENSIDFNGSTVSNLSHNDLTDIGTYSHSDIDNHIDNMDVHFVINDTGTALDEVWSAAKTSAQIETKSNTGHTHTVSDITDFTFSVTNHGDVSLNTTHRSRTDNPHNVTKAQVGLGNLIDIKSNYTATSNPSNTSDITEGYSVGSKWYNITSKKGYECVNASAGSAEWKESTVTINDAISDTDSTWSSSRINSEIQTKSNTGHSHTVSDITDFTPSVTSHSDVSINTTHRSRTDNPHNVTKSQVGLGDVENIKSNYTATTNPSNTSDSTEGYSYGSIWVNNNSNTAYVCVNNTPTEAEWKLITLEINDSTTESTTVWSSDKINATFSLLGHTHTSSDITDFVSEVDSRISLQKGSNSGIAELGPDGKIITDQLPDLAITNVVSVEDISARDLLSPQEGDFAVVTDAGDGISETYIYNGTSWVKLHTNPGVTSVNGKTDSAVVLDTDDINEGSLNFYYTDTRVTSHLDVSANTTHRSRTDNPHGVTIDQVTSSFSNKTKGDLVVHNSTNFTKLPAGDTNNVLVSDSSEPTGLKWISNPKFVQLGSFDKVNNTGIWARVGEQIIYPGSDIDPTKISKILANCYTDNASSSFDIRILDVTATGTSVVALATNNTNTTPSVITLGNINLPTVDSIFEIQVKKSSGDNTVFVRFHSITMVF